jgi:transposase-like protein
MRAALHAKPDTHEIRPSDLPAAICGVPELSGQPVVFGGNLEAMEKQMILQALAQNGDNQMKAAQQLGISSRTLRRKLDKYRKESGIGSASLGTLREQQQRYFRVTVELPIMLKYEGFEIEGTTVNLSSGGVAVQCPIEIAHGSTLEISFALPDTDSVIEGKAKLAWTSPGGLAGLSFEELHPALANELQQWLVERSRAEGWTDPEATP